MAQLRDDQDRYEIVDATRRFELHDPEPFDRLAFAMRTLELLRPKDMTVAVYPRTRDLRIDRGLEPSHGPGGSWALVGIPPHASREHIAVSLAELAGVAQHPFVVALLLSDRSPD